MKKRKLFYIPHNEAVKNYIEILKETFLISEVRPFYTNTNKALVKIPKIYFIDPGVSYSQYTEISGKTRTSIILPYGISQHNYF